MDPALSCAESEELMALAALGVLTRADGAPLDEHLTECVACRQALRHYREAAAMLPDTLRPVEPPGSLRHALMHTVRAEAAPTSPRQRLVLRPRPAVRRRVLSLAGAAVTIAALAVAAVALLHPASPTTRSYAVVGTTSAPAVRGTLTYDSQRQQAVMTVSGLPKLVSVAGAPPQVYEVWLVSAGGAAEGAAFLEQSPTASSWSTVIDTDLSRFVAVAATAEPAGGSPQPTGPQLLSGQVTQ